MNDRFEIVEVINRYFAALDRRTFDIETFKKVFADHAKVTRPNGMSLIGPEAIASSHAKSLERFRATQHLTSGFVIDSVDQANADLRVNLIALHFWKEGFGDPSASKEDNYFLAGGVVSGSVIKTSSGWRISSLRNDVVWRQGVGFHEVLNTK
jgi:hypothetical protein